MSTNNWSAWTDGANKITSSAYKNIAAQLVPILHPTLALGLLTNLPKMINKDTK